MFKTGSTIFLNIPSESASSPTLHRASVVEFSSGGITIAMDESDLPVSAGQDAFLFFERRQTFMQQAVSIQAVFQVDDSADQSMEASAAGSNISGDAADGLLADTKNASLKTTVKLKTSTRLLIGLQVNGEPVSAESRSTYRVVTSIVGGVTVTLDEKIECAVLDVSATGFSVICKAPLRRGQVVRANMRHEANSFQGTAIVQSVKELAGGKIRFGLHCAGDEKSNGSLHRGLQKTSAAIQRQQLRNSSSAA